MTEINNLPKRTKAQKVGESAADTLSATFTEFCNVIPVPQSRDLGIDFICEVMQDEYPTGLVFNAQCKGRSEVDDKNALLSVQVKVTTINYWLSQRSPTFLFVYDRQSENFFWCFPSAYILSLNKEWQSQQSVSIPIPVSSNFSRDITEIPSVLLEVIKAEDLHQKISDLREEKEELRWEYEAELKYQTIDRYQEYWADIMKDEWKSQMHNQE
ncbi:DUF4365 domain-containing protein [Nostoc punctiforme UO1]|uniref:DUF4365 domain-containing protein n=1 Tax=Nostoc punctiforme TaxID=272131 RepID=UPI0030B4D210